jgi:hypothetical protein
MSETLTMNETPADQPEFNADEQDSLQVAESLEGGEQPLLAGMRVESNRYSLVNSKIKAS